MPPSTEDPASSDDEVEDLPQLFALDFCQEKVDINQDRYFAFQVITARLETNAIRIGPHVGVQCRCGEDGCLHIQWLLGQLGLSEPGVDQRIALIGLDSICEDHQWEHRPDEGWDSQASRWELRKTYTGPIADRQSQSTFLARKQAARDIVASFSSDQVYEEFRYDVFDQGDGSLLTGEVYTTKDLSATLCKMLIRNDDIDYHFKHLVPYESRDIDYFHKMYSKGERAVHHLVEYADTGIENSWSALRPAGNVLSFAHDISWCGQELVNITHYVSRRCERRGIKPRAQETAADTLMGILRLVIGKNYSMYSNITWKRRVPHAERTSNTNLFQHLLGPDSVGLCAQGNFIIEGLELIPDACLRYIEELERTLTLLEQFGYDAPAQYRNRLSAFITKLKGGVAPVPRPKDQSPPSDLPPGPGPSGGSGRGRGKRSAAPSDRKGKRRMVGS